MTSAASEATEQQASFETERQLGYARLVGTTIVAASLAQESFGGPGWTVALAWMGCALLASAGAVVLWAVSRGRWTPTLSDRAAWAETLGLAVTLPAAMDEHSAFVILMLLTMSVLASLHDGRRGFLRALAVGSAFELVRSGLGLALADHVHVEDSLIGIVLAGAVGHVVAHVAELSRSRAQRAQRAVRHLELQRRVVLAGIGGREEEALQRMADELGRQLTSATVTIVMQKDGDHPPRVMATTDTDVAWQGHLDPVPGGPLDRTLRQGTACLATPEQLAALNTHPPLRGAVATAPIRRGLHVLGALRVDTPPGTGLGEDDLAMVAQLADQMALVIDAARSLEREVDLAVRYRELDRLKTDFVAITSHELRTPVTTIIGSVETLRTRAQDLRPDEAERLMQAVSRQAHRLSRLIDDLGTVTRVDTGSLTTITRSTDLEAVVREAVNGQSGATVAVTMPADLPAVVADPDRLLQVVSNLVANGEQHGHGTIQVVAEQDGDEVALRVWDEGPGIPAARRDDVFERFVRLGATDSHSRGTGLGLAIARELTEAMGGTLQVTDQGATSCFEVRLPVRGRARTGAHPEA